MTLTPETQESGSESFVSKIAGFAKEVVSDLREDANGKMDQREDNLDAVVSSLDEIERLFGGETDAVDEGEELVPGAEKARAFVNLIRSLLDMPLLEEDAPEPDLSQDLLEDPVKGTRLRVGTKEVQYTDLNFMKFKDVGERLLQAGKSAIGFKNRLGAKNCWDWIKGVYDAAGVEMGKVVYQDTTNGKSAIGEFNPSYMVPGAWIYYFNGNQWGGEHSAILENYDPKTGLAWVLSYTGGTSGTPHRHQENLKEQKVTHIRMPGKEEPLIT